MTEPLTHKIIFLISFTFRSFLSANKFNHRKELHLQACTLTDSKISKPTLLIVDSYNAGVSVPTRQSSDTKLFDEVIATLRGTRS